ncbi:hypothetical protein NEPAR08_2493 [Nematocida parisii]|nr:hypothetical protein NEPAR08_2493 [Nematocida parisii]
MKNYNQSNLREKLKEVSSYILDSGINTKYFSDELINAITGICKKESIFHEKYASLSNFGYNIFTSNISHLISNLDNEYDEEQIVSIVNNSIEDTEMAMDAIQKAAESKIKNEKQKAAYYDMINNNHIATNWACLCKHEFLYNCVRRIDTKKNNFEAIEEKYADIVNNIFELTENKECSRFQRAMDIMSIHGDNISMLSDDRYRQDENMEMLGLNIDDVYSLQLFAKFEKFDGPVIIKHIYDSIGIEDSKGQQYNFYDTALSLNHFRSTTKEDFLSDNKSCINGFKEDLDILKKTKTVFINENVLNNVNITLMGFGINTDAFKNNVVQLYLESVRKQISSISGSDVNIATRNTENINVAIQYPEKTQHSNKFSIIRNCAISIMVVIFILLFGLSILKLFSDKVILI